MNLLKRNMMKKMKFILNIVCIMTIVTLSFSSCENRLETLAKSENEIVKEQSALLERLGLSDFETIILDGTTVHDFDNIEKVLNSAHNIHYNYAKKELIISSTKEATKNYFATLPHLNAQLETARQNALNQNTAKVLPTDWTTLQEKIHNEVGANSTNRSSDIHFHDFYVADYSSHAFFSMYFANGTVVSPIANSTNMNTAVEIHFAHQLSNTPNSFNWTIIPYLNALEWDSAEGHIRNASDQGLIVFFHSGTNYSGNYRLVQLGPNSDVELSNWHIRPNGTDVAQSMWFWKL